VDERLKGLDPKLVELVMNEVCANGICTCTISLPAVSRAFITKTRKDNTKEMELVMRSKLCAQIMDHGAQVDWDDIAGLEHAKQTIKEVVVWPMQRPYVTILGG
jgi:SpoVK/Ycf46/Vps4 family AAA+-type ATPase